MDVSGDIVTKNFSGMNFDEVLEYLIHEVKDRKTLQDGKRHIMTGGTQAITDDIGVLSEAGVEIFMFQLAKPTSVEETLESIERFVQGILTKF